MLKLFSCFIVLFFLSSCDTNDDQQTTNPTNGTVVDSVAVVNDPKNNLNVQTSSFTERDTSGIIIFPLSMGETEKNGGRSYYKGIPYSYYWNIIFYNSITNVYHLLNERKMLISSFETKYSSERNAVSASTNNIFYHVRVDDANNDRKLTEEDPEYLFVSDKEGKSFRQISPAGYHLQNWQFIKASNKLIMTVVKDSDKNKKFGENDEITSFQIDIDKETTPTEIFSESFKNKLKLLYDKDWKKLTN